MKSTARFRNVRLFFLAVLALAAATDSDEEVLRNLSLIMPEAVAVGSPVTITCQYDLQSYPLYTVKLYKSKEEVFRYVPKEMPPVVVFGPFIGKVDMERNDGHRIVVKDVQFDLAGRYGCEVSADAPSFHTEVVFAYMHVAQPPQGNPEIRIEKQRYAAGDVVRGNCTVPPGNPPANVTWMVNGLPVNASSVTNVTARSDENLQFTVAGLNFETVPDNFRNGRLHISCRANVFQLYNSQTDIVLEEERPRLASVLGTRESKYTDNNSRYNDKKVWNDDVHSMAKGGYAPFLAATKIR